MDPKPSPPADPAADPPARKVVTPADYWAEMSKHIDGPPIIGPPKRTFWEHELVQVLSIVGVLALLAWIVSEWIGLGALATGVLGYGTLMGFALGQIHGESKKETAMRHRWEQEATEAERKDPRFYWLR